MVSARTILPRDFDILFSSNSSQPCATMLFGNGSSAAIRNAPVDAMEANDLLTDHVQIGRPVFLKCFLRALVRRSITNGGDIVGKRVQPNVDHVLWIVRHRNAP